ncbi:MAG: tRNA pseudouridine(55) synthase TruB [Clostridia bacterium]
MDGVLIVNKTKGCTSHDIVYQVKKMVNEKVGHTGTLDPMATGVLPLLIGKGTLCSKYLINHDKIYEVQLTLGVKTDTADSEGTIIEERNVPEEAFQKEKIEKVLETFLGKQEQVPPMYSAIKVNGKKLYEYARKGETIEVKPRKIEIYNIELIRINKEDRQIEFKVSCSKGTYIRSLCEDIASRLNTVGYMCELQRLQVGEFNISDSISLVELEKNKENINTKMITIEELFKNNKNIELDDKKLSLFLNGVQLSRKEKDGVYKIYNNNRFIGIGCLEEHLLKRDIII